MPIQIERLKRIIDAAEIFLRRDRRLREAVTHVCALVANGRMSADSAVDELATLIKVTPDYHPAERVIIEEITRYQLTFRRSISERNRARARRAGVPYIKPSTRADPPDEPQPLEPIPELIQKHQDEDQALNDLDEAIDDEIPDNWTDEDEAKYRRIMGRDDQ